ncbi:MAG: hypothetical protein QXR54_02185 [Nanopusillaceae archaeon]
MRSESGIGSLLIFLATIVVAVVAAVVFITTAVNLQQKAFAVGSEARERVALAVDVDSIVGLKTSNGNRAVDRLIMTVKLAPGAEPIKLDEKGTTIQILTPNWQLLSIEYGGRAENSAPENIYPDTFYDLDGNPTDASVGKFYVWVNQSVDRDGFIHIISPGELYSIVIPLDTNHLIIEEMPITVKILSRTGISATLKFRSPTVIRDPIVLLYP